MLLGEREGLNQNSIRIAPYFGIFLKKKGGFKMYFPNKTLKQDMFSMNIWGLVLFCLCILLKKSIQTGLASRTFYNRETNLN